MTFDNRRPGVYSRVEIAGYISGSGGGAALLLPQSGTVQALQLESFQDAASQLAGNEIALECLRLLFGGGAGHVAVILAPEINGALEQLDGFDGVRAVVSGFTGTQELAALRAFAEKSAQYQRECIAFAGIGEAQAAISAAAAMSSGRVVLCCPGISVEEGSAAHPIYGACALAAAVLGTPSPVHNFSGQSFPGLCEATALSEDNIQALLKAGVSVFENLGGQVELIRALTTDAPREDGGGNLRSLNTVLIIDYVMSAIRSALRRKLSGGGRATVEGIRDQVAVELAAKRDAGVIASFSPPRCRADRRDPAICVVEISFGVAHLLSQIHLTAHIRV